MVTYPKGQISEIQRLQMTTVDAPNIAVAAFEGSGDDMDLPIKRMTTDVDFDDPQETSNGDAAGQSVADGAKEPGLAGRDSEAATDVKSPRNSALAPLRSIEIFFYIFEDPDYFEEGNPKCAMASKPLFMGAFLFQQFINVLIIGGTVALCLSTMSAFDGRLPKTSFRDSNEGWGRFWDDFEIVCVMAFSLDFFARMFGAIHRKDFRTFQSQILNWVSSLHV